MKVSEAAKLWLEYHKCHLKENTIRLYRLVLDKFGYELGDENLEYITTDRALSFLNRVTQGNKPMTKSHGTHISWTFLNT